MKKYLLLLAGLVILAPYGQADAKAVKLGRGNAYSVAADAKLNSGKTEIAKPQCDSSCTTCDNATGKCLGCPSGKRPSGNRCVDNCYNVVCKSGYTTEVSGNSCCCVATSCPSGQRLENGKCVANCTGVTCKSGYKAVSNDTGCCCEADASCPTGKWLCSQCGYIHEGASTPIKCPLCASSNFQCLPSCQSGYSYNTTYKGCIKDTLTCNIGCALKGCGIGSTLKPDTGYYIKSDGTCPACSTAIANCAACSISKLGDTPKCTKCNAGYTLSGGMCVKKEGDSCSDWDISYTSCSRGYRKLLSGGSCEKCPANTMCATCPTGCTGSTAGVCNTSSAATCRLCATNLQIEEGCTCPSGYKLTLDRKTCANIAGTGYDMHPTCR